MFERLTERARNAVVVAETEARELNHIVMGTEHLLLALLNQHSAISFALEELGVYRNTAMHYLLKLWPKGETPVNGYIPFSADAKKVLEGALREALSLGVSRIDVEHLLLAITSSGNNHAVILLAHMGPSAEQVRRRVIQALGEEWAQEAMESEQQSPPVLRPSIQYSAEVKEVLAAAAAHAGEDQMIELQHLTKALAEHSTPQEK